MKKKSDDGSDRRENRSLEMDSLVQSIFSREALGQHRLAKAAQEADLPPINISAFEGQLLEILLRMIGAKKGVEIGTLGGYSASWIARALGAEGHLISLEKDPFRAETARKSLTKLGLEQNVEIRCGDAHKILPTLNAEGPFDFVFVDADKKSYVNYFRWSLENLRSGGLLLADNAYIGGQILNYHSKSEDLSFSEKAQLHEYSREDFEGMQAAWKLLSEQSRFLSSVLPSGEGLLISLKL